MIIKLLTPKGSATQADVNVIQPDSGFVGFRFLDAEDKPIDSGGSFVSLTPGSLPTVEDIQLAIDAA